MSEPVKTPLSKMTRSNWIKYRWKNVQTFADKEPQYIMTSLRPIEEAEIAARQWDTMNRAHRHAEIVEL